MLLPSEKHAHGRGNLCYYIVAINNNNNNNIIVTKGKKAIYYAPRTRTRSATFLLVTVVVHVPKRT